MKGHNRPLLLLLGLAALVALAAAAGPSRLWDSLRSTAPAGAEADPAGAKRAGEGDARKVAVVTAAVVRKAMPVEYESVGTVQSTASVTVRPRIDATVVSVAVKDGALVREGDLLISLDTAVLDAQIAQARAVVVRDEAQVDKASRDLARAKQLVAANAGTKQAADDALSALAVAKAAVVADQAAVAVLEAQRDYYALKAPIAGRLGIVSVQAGQLVKAADALATIVSFDPLYVSLGLPQHYLADLGEAQKAGTAHLRVRVPGRTERLEGPVTVIDNSVDPSTGLVAVRALIGNPSSLIWPGEIVDVSLVLRTDDDAIVVPNEAVQTGTAGSSVFVVDDTGHAHMRLIKVARSRGGETVVADGLEAGERVVVDGRLQLKEGALTVEAAGAGNGKGDGGKSGGAAAGEAAAASQGKSGG